MDEFCRHMSPFLLWASSSRQRSNPKALKLRIMNKGSVRLLAPMHISSCLAAAAATANGRVIRPIIFNCDVTHLAVMLPGGAVIP